MRRSILLAASALVALATPAQAHCDAIDGPVATAAVRALDEANVHLVAPYVPASAEAELAQAFEAARRARAEGPAAAALAERYFMETAVRLHRAGEGAPYTGLRPAGAGRSPTIEAAEEALATKDPNSLLALMNATVADATLSRFTIALAHADATKSPVDEASVEAARERIEAEFSLIGYVEAIREGASEDVAVTHEATAHPRMQAALGTAACLTGAP